MASASSEIINTSEPGRVAGLRARILTEALRCQMMMWHFMFQAFPFLEMFNHFNRGKFWFDQTERGSKTLLYFFLYIFCKLQPVSGESSEVMDRESFLEGKTCTLHPEVHSQFVATIYIFFLRIHKRPNQLILAINIFFQFQFLFEQRIFFQYISVQFCGFLFLHCLQFSCSVLKGLISLTFL